MGQDSTPEKTSFLEGEQLKLSEPPTIIGIDGLPFQIPIGVLTNLEAEGWQIAADTREKELPPETPVKEILGRVFLTSAHDFYDFTEALLYLPREPKIRKELTESEIKENLAYLLPTWSEDKLGQLTEALGEIPLKDEPLNEVDYQQLAEKVAENHLIKLEDNPETTAQLPSPREAWTKAGLDQKMTGFALACWKAHQGKEIKPWERRNRFFGLQVLIEAELNEELKLAIPLRIDSLFFRERETSIGDYQETLRKTSTSLLLIPESAELGTPQPLINPQLLSALVVLATHRLTPDSIHPGSLPLLKVIPSDFNLGLSSELSGKERAGRDYCLAQEYSSNKKEIEFSSAVAISESKKGNLAQELEEELKKLQSRLNYQP